MLRAVLEPALLFGSPFAAYAIYLTLRLRYPFEVAYWSQSAIATLALAGLAIAVAGIFTIGVFAKRSEGAYIPAHIENGEIVPGRLQ